MANETSGVFRDPRGFLMPLSAHSPDAFRVLVTRKLEAGWSYAEESPLVKPLLDESVLAVAPPPYTELTVTPDPPPPKRQKKAAAFAITGPGPGRSDDE